MVSSVGSGEPDENKNASWFDLGLFLLIAVFAVWGIGSYGLYEPHEAQYGGGASAMVQRGDWVTTYINGDRELNKPPLFYWLIATSFFLFSHLNLTPEFVARLPLALISLGGTVLAWQWAREIWGLRAGRFAAVMLAVMSGWYVFAHQLMIDELLAVLVLLALYFLWKAITSRALLPWIFFYAAIGLAVMAKGLLGIIFPVAVFGLFVLIRRDWSLIWRARPFLGVLIVALVIGPWAWLFESQNPGAIRYIIVNEHFKRVFDQREPHDYGDVQVSAATFLLFAWIWCAPWSLLLPQVAAFAYRNAFGNPTPGDAQASRRDAVLLLALGATLPALFFVPIPSRLLYYSIPAVPSFSILCAGFWNNPASWTGWKRPLAAGVVVCAGVASIAATFFLPHILAAIPDLEITPGLLKAIPIETLGIGAALLACGALLHFHRERGALAGFVVLMGALEIFNVGEFANFDAITSSRKMVAALAPAAGDDCVWISEGSDEVGASAGTAFYLRQFTAHKDARVLIMNVDPKRPAPVYPGRPLNFFIDQKGLDERWDSDSAVLYVTDFKRTDWEHDKPHLPSRNCRDLHLKAEISGHRRVYANPAAWERLKTAFPN